MWTNIIDIIRELEGPLSRIRYADAKKHNIVTRYLQAAESAGAGAGAGPDGEMYHDPEYVKYDELGKYNRRRLVEVLRDIDTTQLDVTKIYDGPWSTRRPWLARR